ncbi:hypothetical protein C0Q64_15610 [Streptomyces albidoflavus]|nr:hypothetical protein C0Q64_15610 [Streptomyces albidoflavus]RZE01456.1 hypothetical protein C0Q65_15900 [Streptomyces albidoflavus]
MKRFVVVEADPLLTALYARCARASLSTRPTRLCSTAPTAVLDEHLVVDADVCRDSALLDCADVLQGSLPFPPAGALRRLAELAGAHPSAGVAAVPLAASSGLGGWAVTGACDRAPLLVPYRPDGDFGAPSLLPSCLHAWCVAGRLLKDWPGAVEAPLV